MPPILFLIFNRPDVTRTVFAAIREARPSRLYIAADGARSSRKGEKELCDETRKVAEMVDWDCRVYTLFRNENLGCRLAVSSAIDWFFEHEEEGIILEDDCLPDPSFFTFCTQLLEHYRYDTRIGHISGDNFQQGQRRGDASYYFSRCPHIWGWASWRRAWQKYDLDMKDYPVFKASGYLNNMFATRAEQKHWGHIFEHTYTHTPTTWDYQWVFALTKENMLSVLPQVNLVKNIGFGGNATHTTAGTKALEQMPLQSMEGPLRHPVIMLPDTEADLYTLKFFGSENIFIRIPKKILRKLSVMFRS